MKRLLKAALATALATLADGPYDKLVEQPVQATTRSRRKAAPSSFETPTEEPK